MPETIRRTDLLFPTAIDLALLPLFFLAVLRASRGSRRAWVALAALGFFFFFLHPWVLGLVVPPLLLFTLVLLWHGRSRWRVPVAAGATAAAAALVLALPTWDAAGLVRDQAFGRLQALVAHPSSLTPLPRHVDLPAMLGWPALALAGVGAGVAAVRRTRFGLLALCWTALLLPLLLVDWFDIWYLPHRTVAYFAIGVTMLAALAVSEIFRLAGALRAGAERALTLAVVGSLLLVNLPAAATVDPWYRLYGEEDLEAWRELDRRGTPYVEAASWQARMGYRASTGRDAVFNPPFFTDELTREYELAQHPGLVVLVDRYAQEEGVPTGFLEGSDWVRLGTWGTTSAYAHA